ncbi:MAG: hypothetical protein LPJ86_09515 [Caulobacteraceae bacterium]|jgi:hypothetical protein|nr:hypothetical protein [Caulobacteraceae bacterium]MDX5394048.1 hypothetical protein [Caulobacteraceae bacterium]
MRPARRTASLGRIFAAPLGIAAASVIGLVAALVGDGLGHPLSWVTLAAPLAAVIWARFRRVS